MTTPTIDNSGIDPVLMDAGATVNKYAGIGLTGTFSGSNGGYSKDFFDFKAPKGGTPVIVPNRFKGKNGFYLNGPTFNPLDEATARQNAIKAYTQSWAKPDQKEFIDRFGSLLNTYGTTNSAGTILSLAQSGLDPNTPAVQSLIKADAAASSASYGTSKPAIASISTATDAEENWFQNLMQPIEGLARNAFSALYAPFQAIDSLWRTTGGGVAALITGDTDAQQRWLESMKSGGPIFNQTDFGQTLKSMFFEPGTGKFDFDPWSALNQYQAGVDTNRAYKELSEDPVNAELFTDPARTNEATKLAEKYAKEKGYYTEAGWFVDETSAIGEAQRQATYNTWAIPGKNNELTAWTFGRGIAGATVGPDSSAYNAMSGLIDATWNIIGDPFSYTAGLGIGSKVVKNIAMAGGKVSMAASSGRVGGKLAAEGILIGQEKIKWKQAVRNRNIWASKTVEDYNRIATEKGEQLVTPEQFIAMDSHAQAPLVQTVQKGKATQDTINNTAGNVETIAAQAAELRRQQSIIDKVAGLPNAGEDATYLQQAKEIFDTATQRFNTVVNGKKITNIDEYNLWKQEVTPEIADTFDEYVKAAYMWAGKNPTAVQAGEDITTAYGRYVDDVVKLGATRIEGKNVANATADAVRASIENPFDPTSLGDDLPMGTVINGFNSQGAMQGIRDGSAVTVYWNGAQDAVIIGADEIINPQIVNSVRGLFDEVLQNPRVNRPVVTVGPDEIDSLPGQVANQINANSDARGILEKILNDPAAKYGDLLKAVKFLGLDGYLDNFLRQNGIDGIGEGMETGVKGTWFGEHPSIEAYRIPEDIMDLSAQAVNSGDIESFLAQVIKGDRADLNNMTQSELAKFLFTMNSKYDNALENTINGDAAAVENARINASKLDEMLKNIDNSFLDPEEAMLNVLRNNAGMNNLNSIPTLDTAGVRQFLFGNGPLSRLANKSLDALSSLITDAERARILLPDGKINQEEYAKIGEGILGTLYRLTSGQWSADTYRAVYENSIYGRGVDGLVEALSPRLGIDISQGSIAKTTAVLGSDGLRDFNTWHKASPITQRFLYNALRTPEYFGKLRPNAVALAIDNSAETAQRISEYGTFMKIDNSTLDSLVGRVMLEDGKITASAINRNAIVDLWKIMSDKAVEQLANSNNPFFKTTRGKLRLSEMQKAMKESFTLYGAGKTGEGLNREARLLNDLIGTDSALPDLLSATGQKIPTPSVQIESEIASGFLSLPSVDEWLAATTRMGRALSAIPGGQSAYLASKRFYDNFFRTALLVGRVSYILRNSAEMQVRMFMNGHTSILNDPAALIGMAISDFKGKPLDPNSFFGKSIASFTNTVLDTSFMVGKNAQLAATNHIEEYFAILRQNHSLTDPRIYNSAVRQNWIPIAVNAPRFNDGWAHELIMLHRSNLARVILKNLSPVYPGKENAGQQFDNIINYLRSNSLEAQKIRSLFIASDEQFVQIFNSPEAMKTWLFEGPQSVLNRLTSFTMNDPALEDFIKTGVFSHSNGVYNINDINDLQKRIDNLSDALKNQFRSTDDSDNAVKEWFNGKQIKVPYPEKTNIKQGNYFVNKFFEGANTIERLGSVGPEFRMAYWDEIANLAPMLNAREVPRALQAARTTLGPIKRLGADGKPIKIGRTHPAWAALDKQRAAGADGVLTLDEIHEMASSVAATHVQELFYDAGRRNDFWTALRLIFPFGQAWGNTAKVWGELGAKRPIQVYKIDKVLNGLQQEGSSAIYEYMDMVGAIPDYAPGGAPYNQDASGGFFYQDTQGSTKFMLPFAGLLAGLPLNVWSAVTGIDAPGNIGVESPASSLNFASGADSLLPGVSSFGGAALSMLPDNAVSAALKQTAAPFGTQNIVEAGIPPWLQKIAGGLASIPIIGGFLENAIGVLAPQTKNKYVADAMSYLWGTGQYNLQDPKSVQRLNEDTKSLASALLLTNGLVQNVSPSTPIFSLDANTDKINADGIKDVNQYSLLMLNLMGKGYLARAGNDTTQARTDMVIDFGPAALFAVTGDWKAMERTPTSEALNYAFRNPETAKAYNGLFQYFFPNGDTSDVLARQWAEDNAKSGTVRKTAKEVSEEVISWMIKVQRSRLDSFLQAGSINDGQYDAAIDDLKKRYEGTVPAQVIFTLDKGEELTKIRYMYDNEPSIANSKAGVTFDLAWKLRNQALSHARGLTGNQRTSLSGKKVALIKDAYLADIDMLIEKNPDFRLLGSKFKKEWS